MNKLSLYSSLPYWLQNIAVSLHGYKLKKQRFNDDFYKILDFLNSTHGWSKEQIRSYKEEHTFKILEQAYNHCPYYRKKYTDVGLSPSDFKQLGDLQKFPILTKEEIRENWYGLVANNVARKDLILSHTSGSTNKPLAFYHTRYSIPYYWAIDQRYKDRFGFHYGTKCVNFSPRPIVSITSINPPYWRCDRILNRYFINMQQICYEKIRDIIMFLQENQFDYFIGYPSVMTALANEIESSQIQLEHFPKHIFTGAEKIYINQKNVLQRVFKGVEIHELYSFSEEAAVATHCENSIYHEDFEIGHMELNNPKIVDEGLQGDVLATGFVNYGMPFIRYLNGDVAIFAEKECTCGLHSQVIADVVGRIGDYIITPEGLYIQRVSIILEDISDIRECQIVQKKYGEMILRIIRNDNYSSKTEKELINRIRQWISPSIDISFEYVNEIPRTKAGKFKEVVSELKK